jgi:hypothetical protein
MRENQNALSPVQNANPPTPMLCSQAGKLTKVYHADLITEWKRTLDRKSKEKRRKKERLMLSATAEPSTAWPRRR